MSGEASDHGTMLFKMKMASSMYHIRLVDDLARQDSPVHRIQPAAKLIVTLLFLVAVLSYASTEISALMPFLFYPVLIWVLAELPLRVLLLRLLVIEPLILMMGLINAAFNQTPVVIGSFTVTTGLIALVSILIKSLITVSATLLLLMTTPVEKIAFAMQQLKLPRLFVLQFLLTYRYIVVLAEELSHMLRAYFLRAPGQKGLQYSLWGVLSGQLLLRTFERAKHIYQAMILRGFAGQFAGGAVQQWQARDFVFLVGWLCFFVVVRLHNWPKLIGYLLEWILK